MNPVKRSIVDWAQRKKCAKEGNSFTGPVLWYGIFLCIYSDNIMIIMFEEIQHDA